MTNKNNYWIEQLETWKNNGTFSRLEDAKKNKTEVKIRHSSGEISKAVIENFGYGGRMIQVKILGEDQPLYKSVRTEKFLELNSSFGPSLIHLTPKDEQ